MLAFPAKMASEVNFIARIDANGSKTKDEMRGAGDVRAGRVAGKNLWTSSPESGKIFIVISLTLGENRESF